MSWQNLCFSWLLRRTAKSLTRKPGLTAQEMRERSAKWARGEAKPPRGWRVRKLDAQALRGEWIEPEAAERREATGRVILYLHGGGYCFCSPVTHRGVAAALAREADARAFSLDYRLAPEHPFPAAVDDARGGVSGAAGRGRGGGPDRDRRRFVGGRAGARLAAVAARRGRAPLPAGAVLFSPWTDLAATGASLEANDASDVMLSAVAVRNFSRYYLGDAAADHPIASPLYGDYAGLPDLFIQASDTEVLLDDAARVARKASAAGVAVDFKVWRRLPHAWATLAPMLPEARAAIKEAGGFVRKVAP
ncbi:alpha/beta hydrolase [Chromobacterium haemolyticum]|nr:alpha/beta hydrolase [Chromobacterium haemolyticum]